MASSVLVYLLKEGLEVEGKVVYICRRAIPKFVERLLGIERSYLFLRRFQQVKLIGDVLVMQSYCFYVWKGESVVRLICRWRDHQSTHVVSMESFIVFQYL